MIIGSKKNQSELMAFLPSMKANMQEWQIISVKLPERGKNRLDQIIQQLLHTYKDKEGIVFPVSDYKAVLVIRMGVINNYAILKTEIESKLPKHDARVIARKMNAAGLKQIQLDLSDKGNGGKISLYKEREGRKDNVFLIADDDIFVRQTLKATLQNYGEVHEVGDGAQVADEYMKCNPDVVLMDIHMPNKNGLDLVDEIMETDTDSFIVIASSDAIRENVIEAMSGGAAGFLAKPVKKEKILEYMNQCITFQGC